MQHNNSFLPSLRQQRGRIGAVVERIWRPLLINLLLYVRNSMALVYGYVFPLLFLIAFWILYRYETPPLQAHFSQLLTVTAIGGACFGLPTTLVSERERGVWRRYRLLPAATGNILALVIGLRYFIIVSAALVQLTFAMLLGMPLPEHFAALVVAFSCVVFALLGLGLIIAALADNVPTVQALGQCIFLPMLIIGGVAVPLTNLPLRAQHLARFFPGIYAVEAMQACITGEGFRTIGLSLGALLMIGVTAFFAGAHLFRWDARQRLSVTPKGMWVAFAVISWICVGVIFELSKDHFTSPGDATALRVADTSSASSSGAAARITNSFDETHAWRSLNPAAMDEVITFTELPPDDGIVTPIAAVDSLPTPDVINSLNLLSTKLDHWTALNTTDVLRRARALLLVAGTLDVMQSPMEAYVPRIVLSRLKQQIGGDELIKVLLWIALHPHEDDRDAFAALQRLDIDAQGIELGTAQARMGIYAVKLLGRVTGRLSN